MNINFLMSAINGAGEYADLAEPSYKVPRATRDMEPLLLEFVRQLHNPATELFDDRYGTMGPRARMKMQQAEALAEGYQKVAETISLADASEHIPQILDRQLPEDNANFYNTNPRVEALVARQQNAEPLVQDMITMFKAIENIPRGNQEPTPVRPQPSLRDSAPPSGTEPFDNADYSDSDAASYEGDPADVATRRLSQQSLSDSSRTAIFR